MTQKALKGHGMFQNSMEFLQMAEDMSPFVHCTEWCCCERGSKILVCAGVSECACAMEFRG